MRLRDDDGQVLVLALGFLVFFGLVIGALISLASTSVLSTERLRGQRATAYAADGAIDAAIQAGRKDLQIGAFGASPCMHSSSFTTTATTSDGTVVTVTCVADQGPFTDRDVTFTATAGGEKVVAAEVLYSDNIDATVTSGVQVLNWTYCLRDQSSC